MSESLPAIVRPPVRFGAIAHALTGLATPPPVPLRAPDRSLDLAPGVPADLYLPAGEGPHPAALLVHGGAFLIGSRRMKPMRFLADRLSAAGIAVATCDYRLLLRGARHLDDQVADVRAALGGLAAHADALGFDRQRLSAVGLSAGATLTLLAAEASPTPIHHLVSVFALYDLAGLSGPLAGLLGRLLFGTGDAEVWRDASPLARPSPAAPLTLLHGTADGLTPFEQAVRYRDLRAARGLATRLHVYEDAPHGFFNPCDALAERAAADVVAALEDS